MQDFEVINTAQSQVGYHEKVTSTPVSALYPFQNAYDGHDNWTKFHNDLQITQGSPWCGFFCYWVFFQLLSRSKVQTTAFLHNIIGLGGGVDAWENAFNSVNKFFLNGMYTPKPGDVVIFSDDDYTWTHCEIVVDVSGYPYLIDTIGGNTRNPGDPGSQSEGMWVARRQRGATPGSTGFRIRGYCCVDYDNTPSPGYIDYSVLGWQALRPGKRRRKFVKPDF